MTCPKLNLAKQGGDLLEFPEPCPICGKKVLLDTITEWETESGRIIGIEYYCETEPDIGTEEWDDWHNGHWSMPYVYWLPWEIRMLDWINERYIHK